MKVALNNWNVILNRENITAKNYCRNCCFASNVYLCYNLALRERSICRTMKMLDDSKLNEIFKL